MNEIQRMKKGLFYFFAIATGSLFAAMIFYPLGFDQAIYEVGGALIAKKGAVPYRDFLELKQPLIFYIYSISTFLFGRHEWSIHILDIVVQSSAMIILYRLLRDTYKDELIASLTVLLYAIYYTGTGSRMTGEPEGFAILPEVLLLWSLLKSFKQEAASMVFPALIAAVSIWVLVTMKITLGIIVLIIPISFLIRPFEKKERDYLIWFSLSGLVLMLLTIVYFIATGSFDNMVGTFKWLNSYAAFYPLVSIETYREFYSKIFFWQTVAAYSPVVLIFAIIALTKRWITLRVTSGDSYAYLRMLCFVGLILSLIGIAYERKGFNYHYIRGAVFLMPFVAETSIVMWATLKRKWQQTSSFNERAITVSAAVILGALLVLSSNLPRVIDQPLTWSIIGLSNNDQQRDSKMAAVEYSTVEMREVAAKYKSMMAEDGNLFVWGNSAGLYYFFDKLPTTIELVNVMFVTPITPERWKHQLLSELYSNPPAIIISDYHDERPLINGSKKDSYELLLENDELRNFLESQYDFAEKTTHFMIFKRRVGI